jgi:hypothetical protein
MILWDTKKRGGRPDTMRLLIDTWKSFEAEVIFITSNKQGNDDMMRGCYEGKTHPMLLFRGYSNNCFITAGLHAFGTLWDF